MTKREEFEAAAAQRILIKDGPYGTAIQQAGLQALCGQEELEEGARGPR